MFEVAGRQFTTFEMTFSTASYTTGSVSVAVSGDGSNWREVAVCGGKGHFPSRVPADVSKSQTEFTRRPSPIKAHRLKLAREIERLKSTRRLAHPPGR
jgi:hypothetical protein